VGDLFELLRYTVGHDGSDLHLAAGMEPRIRRHGLLESVHGWNVLSHAAVLALLEPVVRPEQWREYQESGDLDFAIGLDKLARFRVNFLRQQNGAAAVFRAIPETIQTLEELGLPAAVAGLADSRSGLVLVTGPTGSGKSTTLAAILHRINSTSARHIVTIENPVEFVHKSIQSVFSQREVGADTDSFAGALRAAMRQDADVILVGEMRDLETMALALRAAEMGTLVFGTLHTSSAVKAIDRLIDAFPADEQAQMRGSLADSLVAVVAQILLPRRGAEGRVAVNEILLRTPALAGIIRQGDLPLLQALIQGGKSVGMQTLDDALLALVEARKVAAEDALSKASERGRFETLLQQRGG
jgi:twitching motility protein PilT